MELSNNYITTIMMWCSGSGVPMRTAPIVGVEVTKLPQYAKVQVLAESTIEHHGVPTLFYDVMYIQSAKAVSQGWVYAGYLEPYTEEFSSGVLKIKNGTPNPNDAEQYLVWHGKTQYNLCGYFSVCYCAGWDATVDDFLDLLKEKKLSLITRRFPAWQSRGTSIYDLDVMLSLFDYKLPSVTVGAYLFDKVADRMMVSPGRFADLLEGNRVIYSVKLDVRSGKIARSGVLHWVVLEELKTDEFRGVFKVYNPYLNKYELYEWSQLIESGGTPYGIVVPR